MTAAGRARRLIVAPPVPRKFNAPRRNHESAGATEQFDDITRLAVRYIGQPQ
jgi:hypothetical protein